MSVKFKRKNKNDNTLFLGMLDHKYTFEEAVARLYSMAGYNIFRSRKTDKYSFKIYGIFNRKVFVLYDYNGDKLIHIAGYPELVYDMEPLHINLLRMMDLAKPKKFKSRLKNRNKDRYSWPKKIEIITSSNNGYAK